MAVAVASMLLSCAPGQAETASPNSPSFLVFGGVDQWRYGDFVLWDNRSVIHKANPDYDMSERRYLYRLMLEGETPI